MNFFSIFFYFKFEMYFFVNLNQSSWLQIFMNMQLEFHYFLLAGVAAHHGHNY